MLLTKANDLSLTLYITIVLQQCLVLLHAHRAANSQYTILQFGGSASRFIKFLWFSNLRWFFTLKASKAMKLNLT